MEWVVFIVVLDLGLTALAIVALCTAWSKSKGRGAEKAEGGCPLGPPKDLAS